MLLNEKELLNDNETLLSYKIRLKCNILTKDGVKLIKLKGEEYPDFEQFYNHCKEARRNENKKNNAYIFLAFLFFVLGALIF